MGCKWVSEVTVRVERGDTRLVVACDWLNSFRVGGIGG